MKTLNRFWTVCICGALASSMQATASAAPDGGREVYVSPNGTDTQGIGSADRPFIL